MSPSVPEQRQRPSPRRDSYARLPTARLVALDKEPRSLRPNKQLLRSDNFRRAFAHSEVPCPMPQTQTFHAVRLSGHWKGHGCFSVLSDHQRRRQNAVSAKVRPHSRFQHWPPYQRLPVLRRLTIFSATAHWPSPPVAVLHQNRQTPNASAAAKDPPPAMRAAPRAPFFCMGCRSSSRQPEDDVAKHSNLRHPGFTLANQWSGPASETRASADDDAAATSRRIRGSRHVRTARILLDTAVVNAERSPGRPNGLPAPDPVSRTRTLATSPGLLLCDGSVARRWYPLPRRHHDLASLRVNPCIKDSQCLDKKFGMSRGATADSSTVLRPSKPPVLAADRPRSSDAKQQHRRVTAS